MITVSGVSKPFAMKRLTNLQDEFKKIVGGCLHHSGENCKMVDQDVGFLLYLTWLEVFDSVEEGKRMPHNHMRKVWILLLYP